MLGLLFTGFDLHAICLMTGSFSIMGMTCGAAICVNAGLSNCNRDFLKNELQKGYMEEYARTQRQDNFKRSMYIYEYQMSNYRSGLNSSIPTRPSY